MTSNTTRYAGGASTDLVPDLQLPLKDQIDWLHIGGGGD
jgi:hypothetical protein